MFGGMYNRYNYQTSDPLLYGILKANANKNRAYPTEAEALLWNYLRNSQLGFRYHRQHIIGRFIADFCCVQLKLIIELDGGYHSIPEQQISDEERTRWLETQGYKVVRFTNEELINDINKVLDIIKNEQNTRKG